MTDPAAETKPPRRPTLHPQCQALGAKFVDFHGWELPIQFSGILKEHEAVRTAAGIFDVSHMGQYLLEGSPAFAFIQRSIASELRKATPGKAIYTHILNEKGGVVDDVLVYCLSPERFFMVVNASNATKDYEHMKHWGISPELMFENASDLYGMLAVQGPKASAIVSQILPETAALARFGVLEKEFYGRACLFARTGYTGEDGFEVIAPEEVLPRFWEELLAKGTPLGLVPCGLGARDTLRLEAGLPLYGNDLDDDHSPLEAGMEWLVGWDAPTFTGKEALVKQKKEGLKRKLTGFKLLESGVPRPGCKVQLEGKSIGVLTSATYSPTLKAGIGMGYMTGFSDLWSGRKVSIEIHGKPVAAMVHAIPFYKSKSLQGQASKPKDIRTPQEKFPWP